LAFERIFYRPIAQSDQGFGLFVAAVVAP
jgi:hypothetical protein